MSEKRRALGRGLGALIPNAPTTTTRPVDVFFPEQRTNGDAPTDSGGNQNGTVAAQQPNPGTLIHLVLAGGRTAPTETRPSPLTMPSFAWKLTDQEIADVATYVRNSWGNSAPEVSARAVAHMRGKLKLATSPPTANSGDRD